MLLLEDYTNIQTHLKYFHKDAFESWLKTDAPIGVQGDRARWTVDERFGLILWLMKHFGYERVDMIKDSDFRLKNNKVRNVFTSFREPFKKHSIMITETLHTKCIASTNVKFIVAMSPKEKLQLKNMLNSLQYHPPTTQEANDAKNVEDFISTVPTIVQRMRTDLMSCEVKVDDNVIMGVVYVIYIKQSLKPIYVGSTKDFKHRKQDHKTYASSHDKQLHTFIKSNDLEYGDTIDFIAISKCPNGCEVFIEAAFYDLLTSSEHFDMQNGKKRPIAKQYTLSSSVAYVYIFVDESRDNLIMYCGSTYNFHGRSLKHKDDCYCKREGNKSSSYDIYKEIRRLNPNHSSWPEHIKIIPVERCPIYLRDQRERHYIQKHDLVNTGNNGMVPVVSTEDQNARLADKRERLNMERNGKGKCQFCFKEMNKSSVSRHEEKFCDKNPNVKKESYEECKYCHKLICLRNMNHHLTLHCKRNPLKQDEKVSCGYCGAKLKKDSLSTHQKHWCKSNPNRASTSSDNT